MCMEPSTETNKTPTPSEFTKGQNVKINISDDKERPQIVEVEITEVIEGFAPRIQFTYTDWDGPVTTSYSTKEFNDRRESTSRVERALADMDRDTAEVPSATPVKKSLFGSWRDRIKKPEPTYVHYPQEEVTTKEERDQQKKDIDSFADELVTALRRLAADEPALIQRWAAMDYMPGLLDQVLQKLKSKYNIVINTPPPTWHSEIDEMIKYSIKEFAAGRVS